MSGDIIERFFPAVHNDGGVCMRPNPQGEWVRYSTLREQLAKVEAENTRIRAALAQSELPCVYCSLPANEWSKCSSGFPALCSKSTKPRTRRGW